MLDEIDLKMNILQPIKSVDLADGGMEKVIWSIAGSTNWTLGILQLKEIQRQYYFFVQLKATKHQSLSEQIADVLSKPVDESGHGDHLSSVVDSSHKGHEARDTTEHITSISYHSNGNTEEFTVDNEAQNLR